MTLTCERCGTAQVDTRARRLFERPVEIFKKPCHRANCTGRVFLVTKDPKKEESCAQR